MGNTYLSRANHINNRLCDVYKECFNEITSIAKEKNIYKIVFGFHEALNIDIPNLIFEKETYTDDGVVSSYHYDTLSEMIFDNDYRYITLIGEHLYSAYMDEYWGDCFDIAKMGLIYQAFMEIVGNDDIKEIETL